MFGREAEKVNVLRHSFLQNRWGYFGFVWFLEFCVVMYGDLVESTDYLGLCVYGFLFSWLQVLGNIYFDGGRRVSHVLFLLFLFIFKIL